MVICKDYKVEGNRIMPLKPISCPYCGGITYIKCYYNRKTKTFSGKVVWYKIQKRVCTECGKYTTVLPAFLKPYKQYDIL